MAMKPSTGKSKPVIESPKKTKSDRIHLRIDPEFKALVRAKAKEDGRSVANWIKWLMQQRIDES